jgi:hypothetical protein
MDKNNNYFSDITDLFLDAKKEERINVDPQTKNAMREMLKYKISEAKGEVQATHDRPNFMDIFKRWKYQLVGVPATLAVLVLGVYAANNLGVFFPKEEPEAGTDTLSESTAEMIAAETDEALVAEKDKAFFRRVTKPSREDNKLLVLDVDEMGKEPVSRSLKPIARLIVDLPDEPEYTYYIYKPDYEYVIPDEPAEPSEPSEPSQPDTSEPKDPYTKPEPKTPPEVPDSTEPDDPSQPAESAEPTEPADPSQPTEPSEPSEPTESADPADPNGPGEPADPADPADPSQPDDTDDPDSYLAYTDPVDPMDPVVSRQPVTSTTPITDSDYTTATASLLTKWKLIQ